MKKRRLAESQISLGRKVVYQILVPGELDPDWLDWNNGLEISIGDDGQHRTVTTLRILADQAGLHGLLRKLYSLGLPLISVLWMGYTGIVPVQPDPSDDDEDEQSRLS